MAPKVNKATQEAMDKFGFEFAEPPAKDNSRRSRYDELWEAARTVCESKPGMTIKTRVYNGSSGAYQDATKINNAEHRMFTDNVDGTLWRAEAAIGGDDDVFYNEDSGETVRQYAVYLTFLGSE